MKPTLKQTTVAVTELLNNYLPEGEARERANNVVQPVSLGGGVSYEYIYASLSPSRTDNGITDYLARRQASFEAAKILIAYQSRTFNAAWVGIQQLGFSRDEASQWLTDRRYYTE